MDEAAPAADQPVAPEPQAPEIAPQDETVNLEAAPESEPEAQAEKPAPEDDNEEIEYEGNKYRVPKQLKDGFLRQSDYTRKTQEVAEQRRTLETAQAEHQRQTEAAQHHIQSIAEVYSINAQIGQLETDWQKAQTDGDPFKASELFQQRAFLMERRNNLAAKIQETEQQRSLQTQQDFAKRYAETNATLARDIKDWNTVAPKVADFAKGSGISAVELQHIAVSPVLTKLLHKAWQADQLINSKKTEAKAAEPGVQAKPVTRISGAGAKPAIDLAKADMASYVAARKAQGFGRPR